MRKISMLIAAAATLIAGFQRAEAGLLGMPMALRSAIQQIKFETPTLLPTACTEFCQRYQDESQPRSKLSFRGGPVWVELIELEQQATASPCSGAERIVRARAQPWRRDEPSWSSQGLTWLGLSSSLESLNFLPHLWMGSS